MKIKDLYLENFTAFDQAKFEFCDGINVLIGANGTGKTHAMKVMYGAIPNSRTPNKKYAISLSQVFNIQENYFARNNKNIDHAAYFRSEMQNILILFENEKDNKVVAKIEMNIDPNKIVDPIYFPTTEMLSIYDHFFATYERQRIPYNRTHYDLALNLNEAILRETHEDYKAIEPIIKNIQEIVTGSKDQEEDLVILENDHFYFNINGKKLDVNLIADGYRKLGTLYYLLRNGSLTTNSILFWDEPEASLNPKLIRLTAETILQLCDIGIQIFIATHSLFLIRELEILSSNEKFKNVKQRYFAMEQTENGVNVSQGNSVEDIEPLVLLDEELEQSDRFMALT